MYDISPKGTVPVIQLENNNIIEESLEIMLWAINKKNIWIDIPIEQQLELINNNDSEFKPWLDKYKYFDRFPENDREFYQEKCASFLSKYNDMVSSNLFLFGDLLMLADAAIFPFVRQCENVDHQWFINEFPDLNKWLNNWKKSNLFLSVMNKYQEWRPGSNLEIVNFNN